MSDRQSDKTGPDLAQAHGSEARGAQVSGAPNFASDAANDAANDNDGDWGLEESRRSEALVVDIDGFEGPLDLLLTLGRAQKVDLRQVSILQLAEQYLAFVEEARRLRLELAADYLVMAAWLAFLKSRLLLPPEPGEEGPSGEDLAAHLAFQLERLAAIREAAAKLMARHRLGRDRFARGAPESLSQARRITYDASLIDLLQAYARVRTRDDFRPYVMDRSDVLTMEEALDKMRGLIGFSGVWTDIAAYIPDEWLSTPERRRSATAATFAAALELAKAGKIRIRQTETFAPIQVRPPEDG